MGQMAVHPTIALGLWLYDRRIDHVAPLVEEVELNGATAAHLCEIEMRVPVMIQTCLKTCTIESYRFSCYTPRLL